MTDVVVRFTLDPHVRDVETYQDLADRPVIGLHDLDVAPAAVGGAVLALLRTMLRPDND